jgi:tetratricopeptide (TPR) repeat protein
LILNATYRRLQPSNNVYMYLNATIRKIAFLFTLTAIGSTFVSAQAKTSTASQFRSITVSATPSAKVWIDGVYYGKTNASGSLTIATVAAGAHTLRLRADGYKEKSQPLAATQRGDVKVVLVKTTDEAELAFQEAERLAFVDREKAIDAYKRAIELRPTFPDAYLALARVQTETGDVDEAEAAINTARKQRPAFAEASAVLGRIHKENGDEDKAIASFKRAITEGKGFQPEAYTGLGLLYKEKAEGFAGSGDFANEEINYNEAAKNLKVALKQLSGAPDTVIIYQLLGLVYERQKNYKEAIATYEEFLRIFPNSNEATAVRSFIVQLRKNQ